MTRLIPGSAQTLSCLAAISVLLSGCSSLSGSFDNKIDYRSGAAVKATSLDVPPDLTQLTADSRFQPQGGTISATDFQSAQNSPQSSVSGAPVAPQAVGEMRIMQDGRMRWLSTPQSAEQLWPQLQAFWLDRGLPLVLDQPEIGVMETEWVENRAKLPQDIVRRTLGRVLDPLFSTGERDKFRVRLERSANGTDIYLSHRGLEEVFSNQQRDSTHWRTRPSDPSLEHEMLARLMVRLGGQEEQGMAAIEAAAATPPVTVPARARLLPEQAATVQLSDGFDRAWRRVGLALDRTGFTVEDRDRAQGVYFVRYVDPAEAGKEDPGFFSRLFGGDKNPRTGPVRLRIVVQSQGDVSTVAVQTADGAPETGETGKRISELLVDELK